jgi:hypothetical protein
MQAELNKHFYNDIANIISDYYYKTMFNDNIKEIKRQAKRVYNIRIYTDSDYDEDDDHDDEDKVDYNHFEQMNWIISFRRRIFNAFRLRYWGNDDESDDEF